MLPLQILKMGTSGDVPKNSFQQIVGQWIFGHGRNSPLSFKFSLIHDRSARRSNVDVAIRDTLAFEVCLTAN